MTAYELRISDWSSDVFSSDLDVAEARAPARGKLPVLALYIVNDGRAGPAQQRGDNKPDPFTAAGRREGHDMLRPVVAKIAAALATKEYTRVLEQARSDGRRDGQGGVST